MKITTLTMALAAITLSSISIANAKGKTFGLSGSTVAEFDTDGDGTLSEEEREAAKEARQAAREAARQAILDEFDVDEDGVLNEEERAAAKEAREAERAAAREARFAEIDGEEGDGELTAEELQAALPDASEERIANVIARYDADENGTVSLEEFTAQPDRSAGNRRSVFKGRSGSSRVSLRGRKGRVVVIRRGGSSDSDADGEAAPTPAEQ